MRGATEIICTFKGGAAELGAMRAARVSIARHFPTRAIRPARIAVAARSYLLAVP
jgi:hypothetical protein